MGRTPDAGVCVGSATRRLLILILPCTAEKTVQPFFSKQANTPSPESVSDPQKVSGLLLWAVIMTRRKNKKIQACGKGTAPPVLSKRPQRFDAPLPGGGVTKGRIVLVL